MMKYKAAVTIYSFMLYVLITLALITIVYRVAMDSTNKYQQQNNFDTMVETIQKIDAEVKRVSQSMGSRSQIIVYNPQEIEINCLENSISGKILYEQEFRSDLYIVHNIKVSKINNDLEFFLYDESESINLFCGTEEESLDYIFLNKGKNTLNIVYKSYNVSEQKINIEIYVETGITTVGELEFVSLLENKLTIMNTDPRDSITVTGYQIFSSDELSPLDEAFTLDEPLEIAAHSTETIDIFCSPEEEFIIRLYADKEDYDLEVNANDSDASYCYTEGLIGWWKFEGNANDISGNDNHGVVYNNPLSTFGKIGLSYQLNGINNYILVEDKEQLRIGTNDFTIIAWVYYISSTGANSDVVFGKGQTGTGEFMLYTSSNRLRFYANGGAISLHPTTTMPIGEWFLYTVTRNGDNAYLYKNNEEISTQTGVNNIDISTTKHITIGASNEGLDRFVNGIIDEVRFYDRALSPQEIQEIYTIENG